MSSLLSLGIDPGNIISLFTLLSPFFISTFLIFFGALQGSLSGLFWLIGVIIAQWGVGFFLVRTAFSTMKTNKVHKKFSSLIKSGTSPEDAYNQLKGQSSSRRWWTKKDGKGANFKDMCSLFLQPYDNSIYSQFSMPSLNTIFLVFTIIYSAMCGFQGNIEPQQSVSTTVFVLILTAIFILNSFSLWSKKCSTIADIAVGIIIGGALAPIWYYIGVGLDKSLYPNKENSILFFKHKFVPKGASKCSVENQAFRCEIDDSGFDLNTDEDDEDDMF